MSELLELFDVERLPKHERQAGLQVRGSHTALEAHPWCHGPLRS
jgi:hypothetical protein